MSDTRTSPPTTRPSLAKWLDPAACCAAVQQVYIDNGRRTEPPEQASENWTLCSGNRYDLWLRSSWHWERETGIVCYLFPLSEDAVCRLYIKYRKRGSDNVPTPQLQETE